MVKDPNHPVFDRTEPSWTNSDMYANISEISFSITYDEVTTVEEEDPYFLTTTTIEATLTGTATVKIFNQETGSGTSGRLEDEFRGFSSTQYVMPPVVRTGTPAGVAPLGTDKILAAGFAGTGLTPIGTITVDEDDGSTIVTTVTDILNDAGDTGFTIERLLDGDPEIVGSRADREGRIGFALANSSFSLGAQATIDLRALLELGTATATESVTITEPLYTLSRTVVMEITTA